jgi:hypothetical protein
VVDFAYTKGGAENEDSAQGRLVRTWAECRRMERVLWLAGPATIHEVYAIDTSDGKLLAGSRLARPTRAVCVSAGGKVFAGAHGRYFDRGIISICRNFQLMAALNGTIQALIGRARETKDTSRICPVGNRGVTVGLPSKCRNSAPAGQTQPSALAPQVGNGAT